MFSTLCSVFSYPVYPSMFYVLTSFCAVHWPFDAVNSSLRGVHASVNPRTFDAVLLSLRVVVGPFDVVL